MPLYPCYCEGEVGGGGGRLRHCWYRRKRGFTILSNPLLLPRAHAARQRKEKSPTRQLNSENRDTETSERDKQRNISKFNFLGELRNAKGKMAIEAFIRRSIGGFFLFSVQADFLPNQ
jgi:hypothetical protein